MNTETDYSYLGEPSTPMKLRKVATPAVLAIYGVLLIVLFALYGSVINDDDSDSSSQTGAIGRFQSLVELSSAQVGMAVSLSAGGGLQLGAGTSVYKDLFQLEGVCAKATAMEPVLASSYVMTFINGVKDSSTISILQSDSARSLTVSLSVEYEKQLVGIAALDAGEGLLVGVAQDMSAELDEAVVVALLAGDHGRTLSFGQEALYGGVYSVNPQITRLSGSSFALTYLDNVTAADGSWAYSALVRHGSVAADLSITLSEPVIFASDYNYELQTSVVGLTASTILLVLNAAEQQQDGAGPHFGPLQARLVSVAPAAEGAAVSLSLGALSTFPNNIAAFNMDSARVDDATALLAYCDYRHNFGVSVVALQVASGGALALSAALPLTSGRALAMGLNLLQMDLDVAVFGGGQFVVTYSDVTNSGRLTAATGALGRSGELSRTSPDLLLSAGSGGGGDVYQWQAVAVREGSAAQDAQIAIASSLQDLDCDLAASSLSVAVMHVLPAALGLVHAPSRSGSQGQEAEAQLSGWASGFQGLQPGMLYYANTFGEVISAGEFCGREGAGFYAQDQASASLMTARLGVAVSDSTLLLQV